MADDVNAFMHRCSWIGDRDKGLVPWNRREEGKNATEAGASQGATSEETQGLSAWRLKPSQASQSFPIRMRRSSYGGFLRTTKPRAEK